MWKEPWHILASCFTVSSIAGLAQLLRSDRPLTWRNIVSAVLYSGISGLIIGLLWFNYFSGSDNVYFLVGISGLAGIGSVSILDLIMQLIAGNIGLQINVKKPELKGDDDDSRERSPE